MSTKFAVRNVRFSNGERFPILVERATGFPLFEPTVFAVTEVRSRNRAAATIDQVVRAISVFHLFVYSEDIDFEGRVRAGRLLELGEVDSLSAYCRRPVAALDEDLSVKIISKTSAATNVLSLEKVRMTSHSPQPEISAESASIRLRYIREYINWVANKQLMLLDFQDPSYFSLKVNAELVGSAITARLPSDQGRNTQGKREGLAPESLTRLLEVINPNSPDNVWSGSHVRERNALMITCLLALGVRRGELLGVRIEDIDFQKNEIFIARRPDDPDDYRGNKPNTKTKDRILPIDENLSLRLRSYIMGPRRTIIAARKHSFLFVANGTGAPLSLSALTKIFTELRKQVTDLPDDLSSHILRHTWNDQFSEHMDASNTSEEKEKKMRSYLMGWSEFSNMAATYTRRHVRETAKKVSISMQNSLVKSNENAK